MSDAVDERANPAAASPATLPLRPALKSEGEAMSPHSGPSKVVSIAEPDGLSPLMESEDNKPKKHHRFTAGLAKRLTGRPVTPSNNSSRLSLVSQSSTDDLLPPPSIPYDEPETETENGKSFVHSHHHSYPHAHTHEKLLTQVAEWLQAEKARHASRKSRARGEHTIMDQQSDGNAASQRSRKGSQSSDTSTSISLEKLQRILEDNMSVFSSHPHKSPNLSAKSPSLLAKSPSLRPRFGRKRRSSMKSTRGGASSDTDYFDGDVLVPSCDAVLDNSGTMGHGESSRANNSSELSLVSSAPKRQERERAAWFTFKNEIVRLAHTLRLKGWRRVPLDRGCDIEVQRLSGALTNAVYVVSPPKDLPAPPPGSGFKKPPPKLLLRIYGPQVEHLIDREGELSILRRLARKKIGPRLLGTFKNGRFEEFFEATTLTAEDLRVPATFKQIAKRMRELHDGIELLEKEKDEGPFVWQNWDKWVERCDVVTKWLDRQILEAKQGAKRGRMEAWKERGLVCGVRWEVFRDVVEKYRAWLEEWYGGREKVRERLVFAHNDTQYGNILRLQPPSSSPLLMPSNSHKRLIVIDFEYASANPIAMEFANHFTEWCYNYTDSKHPYRCDTARYPSPEEQREFIKAYVEHRPGVTPATPAATPLMEPMSSTSVPDMTPKMEPARTHSTGVAGGVSGTGLGSISSFMLDSRYPAGHVESDKDLDEKYKAEEAAREKSVNEAVERLMIETRVWRVANSAMWVAWGIVQAELPEEFEDEEQTPTLEGAEEQHAENEDGAANGKKEEKRPEGLVAEALMSGEELSSEEVGELQEQEQEEGEEKFDYLGYAHERAMFFWADVAGLGIVKEEELPEEVRRSLKRVAY